MNSAAEFHGAVLVAIGSLMSWPRMVQSFF